MAVDNVLTIQWMDPIQYLGVVGLHIHSGMDLHILTTEVFLKIFPMLGGSNFSLNLSTMDLWGSKCTLIPVQEDKSNYWYPVHFYI
ncbi:hypothetical protein EDD18DRAFT_1082662 [Armillaria luteobubalina]|uniref:DUF1996 domain-containing protein n=1 Tax=Armillaria luteobubalina TaxID=153913 RepID=A0AA39PLZ7_9AGAR|nr:hypothetical protein EDD18DRAFT_1082662 [Armillaria luteobubalina]